jgi:hypothetical protein
MTIDECFGAGEVLSYSNIDELLKVISKMYDDLEMAQITNSLEDKLTVSDET